MQKIIHFLKNFFSYKEVATGNWNMCDVTEGKLDNLLYAVVKLLVAEISFRFIHTKFLIGNCTSYSCAKLKMKFKMEKVVMDAVVANWCFRDNIVKEIYRQLT